MNIRHIYWFAYYNFDEPSVRYRAKFPLEQLEKEQKITYSIVYPGYGLKNIINFILIFFSALFFRKSHSIIVFQKIYTNGVYSIALKLLLFFRREKTLYDIDDAEYSRRSTFSMHYFMKRCSSCSAGSESLVEYIKRYNKNTFLLTSPVINHGLIKNNLEQTLTIGWIGYYGAHRQSLTTLFFPAIYNINFPLKLKLLGVTTKEQEDEIKSYFFKNKNIIIETPLHIDWFNENFIYENIRNFDIGISPLIDNEFNRGKSAFKLKQCLSCGVPVLGSSVGENRTFLKDGLNGYFCDEPNHYFEKITAIKNLKYDDYLNLSRNAKDTFPSFSVDSYCSTFLNFF